MPGTQRKGRTRRERANADNLKAQHRQPCLRCGQAIDYSLPPEHPEAFMAGHVKAWIHHPELRDDPANLQQEHARCGKSAGTKDGGDVGLGVTSQEW